MSRDPLLYLEDILNACEKVMLYCDKMAFEDFIQDSRTYDAVIRNLEIIGEAASKLTDEFHQKFSQVEWRSMRALRNIIAHEYFRISDMIVWDIVINKIPPLQVQITEIIQQINGQDIDIE